MRPKLPESERISVKNGARAQYDDAGKIIVDMAECLTCRRKWNDALISERTPTPGGRCPYEYWHTTPAPLPSTVETDAMSKRVLRAFRQLNQSYRRRAVFEHGHWWVLACDAAGEMRTFDAVDADGPGSTLGFSFEEV